MNPIVIIFTTDGYCTSTASSGTSHLGEIFHHSTSNRSALRTYWCINPDQTAPLNSPVLSASHRSTRVRRNALFIFRHCSLVIVRVDSTSGVVGGARVRLGVGADLASRAECVDEANDNLASLEAGGVFILFVCWRDRLFLGNGCVHRCHNPNLPKL